MVKQETMELIGEYEREVLALKIRIAQLEAQISRAKRFEVLDVKAAAQLMNCSTALIYKLVRKGELSPLPLNGHTVFNKEEIISLINRKNAGI